jgi:Na+/H+ antiporter NhaA
VSLFVTALAFEAGATADTAKVGILAAAVAASLLASALLRPRR